MLALSLQPEEFDLALGVMRWLIVFGIVLSVSLLVSLMASLATYGATGPARLLGRLGYAARDFLSLSPRRIFAVALLTFREAVRRKALLVFVVFAVLFMFASWFLTGNSDRPEQDIEVYVGFVFTTISWLVLLVGGVLSCFGLPEDIRLRSLHTVVTKPVRRNEIVIGRMMGFGGVCTLILVLMGIIGQIWIVRQSQGLTLSCRVPIYGVLKFLDRTGAETSKGLNVGDIVETRGFIEGGTKGAAVFQFRLPKSQPELLRFESRFEAFRTHKGSMDRTIQARYVLSNEEKGLRVPLEKFNVAEFSQNERDVERKISYTNEKTLKKEEVDLYNDVAQDGWLTVHVQCLDRGQYLGASRGDFFIRELPDRSFAAGYWKAMVGVWLMVILLVMIAVTASCFVKGPVACLLCFCVFVLGQPAHDFMDKLVTGKQVGGGATESLYRLVSQANQTTPLDNQTMERTLKAIDRLPSGSLWIAKHLIPDMRTFSMAAWVGKGLDVPWYSAMLPSLAVALGYILPCVLLGYFSLSLRELESK